MVELRTSSFSAEGAIAWRQSGFSAEDGNCAEFSWRKSSFSGPDANCVEVARRVEIAAVRDSKNPDGPRLALSTVAYRAWLASLS